MDNDNEFNYSPDNRFKQLPRQKGPGFGKVVLIPFISGILGAAIVLGACLGIPEVRNNLINSTSKSESKAKTSTSTTNTKNNSEYNATLMDIAEFSETSVAVAEKVLPSVVGITVTYNVESFYGSGSADATGSGVIISDDGYILTNNHVVSTESTSYFYTITEATAIKVHLYGTPEDELYDAEIVGKDSETDLAVLKIEAEDLPAITMGDSSNLRVGEFVMAVGNPLGLDSSVTSGIISALDRQVTDDYGNVYNTIQTDAPINSGNSGGALVNSKGELIGINFLKLSDTGVEGLGFAIPINDSTNTVNQLIEFGETKKPYIGIAGRNVTQELSEEYNSPVGIYVDTVNPGTPAEEAGLKKGDIITQIDGHAVKTIQELNAYKAAHYNVGDQVTLNVYRDDSYKNIKLTLGEMPKDEEGQDEETSSKSNKSLEEYYDSFDNNNNYYDDFGTFDDFYFGY